MFGRIHEKLGTAGLVVAIVALVAALAGSAYAAGGGLNSQQKKEVKKIAKQYAGEAGPAGPQGHAGANGTNGADGISPVGTAFSGEANGCKEGGVKFVGANTTTACNGAKGSNGTGGKNVEVGTATGGPSGECEFGGATVQVEGEASTKEAVCNGESGFTEVLPSGKTETGAFALSGQYKNFNEAVDAATFAIPLSSALDGSHVHGVANGEEYDPVTETFSPAVKCTGSAADPTAPAGELCVYTASTSNMFIEAPLIQTLGGSEGADQTGAALVFLHLGEGFGSARGAFAVTAP